MLFLAVVLVGSLGAARARQRPVGGEESVPFSRSHIVRFAYRPGTDLYWESFCGGTLLAPEGKVVISAAHCFFDDSGDPHEPVGEIVAAVHRHDLTKGPDEHECSALIEVEEVIKHPRYNTDYYEDFDVAIVKLKDAPPCVADGTGRTSTAYLDPEYSQPGAVLRAEGWGATDQAQTYFPNKLHEVYLNAMSNAECRQLHPWALQDGILYVCISDNMLCARAPGKDACVGDSGGPLVYEDEDGTTMLVGITSWGPEGCAIWDTPGVWCRVSEVIDWIAEHVDVAAPGSVAPTLSKSPTVAPSAAPSATPTVSPAPTYAPKPTAPPSSAPTRGATCFSDPGVAIANCECHETCATCGFNDEPTKKKDCITCASGVAVTPYFDDGTGTCDAAPKGKGKKKK